MIDNNRHQVELKTVIRSIEIMMIDLVTSLALIALGFVPTFGAMEAAWKMGKRIGRSSEKTVAWRSA